METVESGWNRLAGTETERILSAAHAALLAVPPEPGTPYGNGHAAETILEIVAGYGLG